MGDEPPDEALARSEVIPGLPNSQKDVMSHAIEARVAGACRVMPELRLRTCATSAGASWRVAASWGHRCEATFLFSSSTGSARSSWLPSGSPSAT